MEVRTTLLRFWQMPRTGGPWFGSATCGALDQKVDPHISGLLQIVALGVGMHERAAPLPVFRGALGVEDQRVGLGPLADRV